MAEIGQTLWTGELQAPWDIEAEPELPNSFNELPNGVLRSRARDALRSAYRLRSLTKFWERILTWGMFNVRLDAETDLRLQELFPELSSIGSVLAGLARTIACTEGLRESLNGFARKNGVARKPDPVDTAEVEPFDLMEFEKLRWQFLELIRTESRCLHLLEVNVPQFRRSWAEIDKDNRALFQLDKNWSFPPVIHFGPALINPNFRRAKANLISGAEDVLKLLARHPGTVLERPGQQESGPGRTQRGSSSLNEVNEKARKHLRENHAAKSAEIAASIGCSESQVRKTPAWQAVSRKRSQRKYIERAGDSPEFIRDKAMDKISCDQLSENEAAIVAAIDGKGRKDRKVRAVQGGDREESALEVGGSDPMVELTDLIAAQEKDRLMDKRRPRRSRPD